MEVYLSSVKTRLQAQTWIGYHKPSPKGAGSIIEKETEEGRTEGVEDG